VTALRVSAAKGLVRFAVDDDGKGFSDDEITRAFEPFYRGDGARKEGRPGVGLGLALVRRIAEVHGGRAWAENLPERGARVGVELAV
jgi:two-component system, OmpR family, sensor kinase